MRAPDARAVVAVMLTTTICAAILAPILARVLWLIDQTIPEPVAARLADLLKVPVGAVVGWLAAGPPRKDV